MSKLIDFTGQQVGILTVLNRCLSDNNGNAKWNVKCNVCGLQRKIISCRLKRQSYKKCSCANYYKLKTKYTKEYEAWRHMKDRCLNPNNKSYLDYGGRGIFVCERWQSSFVNFLKDMKICPKNYSLDRIDNNEGYYLRNCRWTTSQQQVLNRRVFNSKLGYTGISKRNNTFVARFKWNYKLHYIGNFKTIKEAVEARNKYIIDNNLPHQIQEYVEVS